MAANTKSARSLNTIIAKSHQFTTQMIGVQLSIANLLAIAVSAASVVAGCVTITALKFPTGYILWAAAGVIGLGLAFLIEGMTLGALIRIRIASKHIKDIEVKLEDAHPDLGLGQSVLPWSSFNRKKRRLTRMYRRSRSSSIPLVIIGSVSSSIAGGLFYHTVLAGLGTVESLVVAALFPFVVTCTFISSELFKADQEEAIKEGFSGGGLGQEAIKAQTEQMITQFYFDNLATNLHTTEFEAELRVEQLQAVLQIARNMSARSKVLVTEIADVPALATTGQALDEAVVTPVVEDDSKTEEDATGASESEKKTIFDEMRTIFNDSKEEEQDDKLTSTLAFFDSYPQLATTWTENDDARLAEHLGLKRVASARFWRLKALEIWQPKPLPESASDGRAVEMDNLPGSDSQMGQTAQAIGQKNDQRILDYIAQHPDASYQEIAEALSLSARTVQRRLSRQSTTTTGSTTGPRLKVVRR